MRVPLTLMVLLLFFGSLQGQEEKFRKNTISLESGIFSRGIIGISYSRRFLKTNHLSLSADIFTGLVSDGPCVGGGFNLNLGRNYLFLTLGIDGKWYPLHFSENLFIQEYSFKGMVCNPYLGLSIFAPYGFTVKLRAGLMPVYQNHSYDWVLPSLGASIGHSF